MRMNEVGLAEALKSPQLSGLNKLDPGSTAEALSNLIIFASKQFNVGRNLTDAQVGLLAPEILRRFWYLKFDELVYVFREAIAGKWGKNYGHVDAQVVMGWIEAYEKSERDAALAREIAEREKAYKLQEKESATGIEGNMEKAYWVYKLRVLSDEELPEMLNRHGALGNAEVSTLIHLELQRREKPKVQAPTKEEEYEAFKRQYTIKRMQDTFNSEETPEP